MAKQDEVAYLDRICTSGVEFAAKKPFSDPDCGNHLAAVAALFMLLPRRPARLLDLGCGTGWTSRFFAQAGFDVVGVDIAPSMIAIAQEYQEREGVSNLTFRAEDYENLDFREEFDAVVFFDSLHHADDEELALRRACQALRPGGVCVLSEPGRGHHDSPHSQQVMREYGVTEKDMPPDLVIALGRRVGFETFQVFPHPAQVHSALYQSVPMMARDPFDPHPYPSRFGALGMLLNRVRGKYLPKNRYLAPCANLFATLRDRGLVVMRK